MISEYIHTYSIRARIRGVWGISCSEHIGCALLDGLPYPTKYKKKGEGLTLEMYR